MIRFLGALSLVALAFSLSACGGSGSEAKSGGDGASSGSGDSGWTGGAGEAGPSGPTGPDCSDGTCFECGEGICPTGAYCDQDANGGAACAWLPECTGKFDCSCVTGVLQGCSCNDTAGGPSVTCQ